tara:strand:- start:183 stop:1058 length:876 start_codon:yes stop_codon:yes gene_type:complete
MVSYLSSVLEKNKVKHSIVSRGYKKRGRGLVVVSNGLSVLSDSSVCGDEPLVLATKNKKIPIVVGNKVDCCVFAQKNFLSKTIIIDDGFQSHYIKKDLEILLIDTSVSINQYFIFPVGKLREPLTAISRAKFVIFTKTNLINKHKQKIIDLVMPYINLKNQLVFHSSLIYKIFIRHNNQLSLYDKKNIFSPVFCVSGIATNHTFLKMINGFCDNVSGFRFFHDHHNYSKKDVNKIKKDLLSSNCSTIITTLKDYVKLKKYFSNYQLFVIDVDFKINNNKFFVDCLLNELKK